MKHKILKRLSLILLLGLTCSHLWAATTTEEKRITQPIDVIGTGGAGIASYDRFGMIFMNPASLGLSQFQTFSVLKIGASANWDLYDYYQISAPLLDNTKTFDEMGNDFWANVVKLRANVGISGPLTLGYIGNNIGLLLYNDINVSMSVHQAPGLPYVDYGNYVDVGFIVSYGFEIPLPFFLGKFTKAYFGLSLKYLNRVKYENHRMSILEFYDLGMGIMNFSRGLYWGQNIGSDVGMIIKIPQFAFGFTVRDWFGTGFSWSQYGYNSATSSIEKIETTEEVERTFFPASLDIGVSYKRVFASVLLSEFNAYFDIVDSLDFSENYLLKLRMGIDFTLLKVLIIRGGFYQGYPTLGLGIDIPVLKINLAYYTEELGTRPGTSPQSKVMADIELMF